jgi:hypothetical protein
MMALVWGGTLNSSAANLSTAVKGAASGTLNLRGIQSGWVVSGSGSAEANTALGGSDLREGGREGGAGTHTLKGSLGSDVRMILKDTFPPPPPAAAAVAMVCLRFEEKDCVFLKRTRLIPLVFSASFFSY